jgi:tetratricopeptide (TPR) repeat protein
MLCNPVFGQTTTEEWFNEGNEFHIQDQYKEAIKAYDEAIQIDPNCADAYNYKCDALNKLGKYDEALENCDRAIQLYPTLAESWNYQGNVLANQSKYNEALQAYDKAIQLCYNLSTAWQSRGDSLAKQQVYTEDPIDTREIYCDIALIRAGDDYQGGRCDKRILAGEAYDKAIELNPTLAVIFYNKGSALANLNKYDEAIQAYNMAIQIVPAYCDAWSKKSNVLKLLNRTSELNVTYAKIKEFEKSGCIDLPQPQSPQDKVLSALSLNDGNLSMIRLRKQTGFAQEDLDSILKELEKENKIVIGSDIRKNVMLKH